jgi:hypothetical protein
MAGARIAEVGSVEKLRLHGESNLNAVGDGLRVLRTILHERRHARSRRRASQAVVAGSAVLAESTAPALPQQGSHGHAHPLTRETSQGHILCAPAGGPGSGILAQYVGPR